MAECLYLLQHRGSLWFLFTSDRRTGRIKWKSMLVPIILSWWVHSNMFNICHLVKHASAPVNSSMSFAFLSPIKIYTQAGPLILSDAPIQHGIHQITLFSFHFITSPCFSSFLRYMESRKEHPFIVYTTKQLINYSTVTYLLDPMET